MSTLRSHRAPIVALLAYVVLRELFIRSMAHEGLVTPHGAPRIPVLACGIALLVLRIIVLFVVPALVTHRLLATIWADQSG